MRLSRIAAIALLSTAAIGTSATAAYADDGWRHHHRTGEVEAFPHVVMPGHIVRFSTEACHCHEPAKVHVDIDGVRHWVWLNEHTSEGATGFFRVPRDTDSGRYEVEGWCDDGPGVEGTFWVHHHHHHED